MTLQVSFEQFGETAKRLTGVSEAYVAPHEAGAIVTAGSPEKSLVLAALTSLPMDRARTELEAQGLSIFPGHWSTDEAIVAPNAPPTQFYVAAVGYRSSEDKPGVWVDAYDALPTQVSVLKTMYEEFRATGQVDEVGFDEFVQMAACNVIIVSPTELESYRRANEEG